MITGKTRYRIPVLVRIRYSALSNNLGSKFVVFKFGSLSRATLVEHTKKTGLRAAIAQSGER